MAFVAAVRRRFPAWRGLRDRSDHVRRPGTGWEQRPARASWTLAEQLILSALRGRPAARASRTRPPPLTPSSVLLRELVSDLDGDQLSALLAGARDDAERAGAASRPVSTFLGAPESVRPTSPAACEKASRRFLE